jgi:RNA polymerase sigma-70 factor (ECF subfamily)
MGRVEPITGMPEHFDQRVAPHLERLFRVAYRLVRNTADAEDLVQDTCIIACENLTGLKAADNPAGWLLRVLHNRFIDGVRRRKNVPFVGLDEGGVLRLASPEPGPEQALQHDEAGLALERAFLTLEPMQRTLLSLRAEGYGLLEIESITGIGSEVLRSRLHRARRSLAQRLDQHGEGPLRLPHALEST